MAPRSSKLLIHREAHFVLRPSDSEDPFAPWELLFANGPIYSNEPEHQAVTIALSPSYNTTGDPEGDYDLGVEYLKWVADNLSSGLQRNLILPVQGSYIAPNGSVTMMTPDMKDRYGWPPPYGTKIHRDLEDYFTAEQRQMRLDRVGPSDMTEEEFKRRSGGYTRAQVNEMSQQQYEELGHHDDSPYNIHHKHDTPDKD